MAHGHGGMGSDGHGDMGMDFGGGFGCHDFAPHVSELAFAFDHDGFAGHSTVDAIMVAHAFDAHGHNSAHVDSHVGMNGHFTSEHVSLDAVGATFHDAAKKGKQYFGLVVVGHGYLDLIAQAKLALAKAGLVEMLAVPQGYNKRCQETTSSIKPLQPKSKQSEAVMPSGWYEGANGLTTEWRAFFQVGEKGIGDFLARTPGKLPKRCSTIIEVEMLHYFYGDKNCYETRIGVRVHSQKMYVPAIGDYVSRGPEVSAHLKSAASFCETMAKALHQAKPSTR